MFATPSARATLRLAIFVLGVGALAGVWEAVAAQAPGSPLYIGMLPGPVQSLREAAFTLGFVLLSASLLFPLLPAAHGSRKPRSIVIALHAGTLLALGASIYGACCGMHGEQLYDLRPDGMAVFVTKHAGYVLVAAALLPLATGVLRALRAPR